MIHEAWLRLFGSSAVSVQDRQHLLALMATQMRRALVDHARHRNAAKGPGHGIRVSLTDTDLPAAGIGEDVVADALGISLATLKRDWAFARAWLFDHLSGGRND